MAAQNKLFQRLIWLVDTVHSAGHITKDELDRRWSKSAYNYDHESKYGDKNLYRHRETIAELFGIEILCNRATSEYYIAELGDLQSKGIRTWILNTFAVNNMVNLTTDIRDRVIFEDIPEGSRFLSTIVTAMKDNRQLYATYQGFNRAEPHSFLLAPYCLKVFKQRWYLVGKPADHPEEKEPRVYALDRMHELTETDQSFRLPKSFRADKFFENQFGIDRRLTKAEHIRIRVNAYDANFMRTLPIHESQREIERTDEYSIFAFRLAPTYDFIQELRKFGSTLEVLEPEELRKQFAEDASHGVEMYFPE
jgi:predicted DNA-binding transcriptional regulator YafY